MGNQQLTVKNNSGGTISVCVFKRFDDMYGLQNVRLISLASSFLPMGSVSQFNFQKEYKAIVGKAGNRFEPSASSGNLTAGQTVTLDNYNNQVSFGQIESGGGNGLGIKTSAGFSRDSRDVAFGIAVGDDAAIVASSPQPSSNYSFRPQPAFYIAIGNAGKGEFVNDDMQRNAIAVDFSSDRMTATCNVDGTWSVTQG
ncbi:hypothetical protein D0C36_03590 [Mucilaginibacter conchicola]|uniref:Uncharacterized protein n=1 Tax=Mucilaginibacter conchicola TaxID=2303333 RepID=A0A372NYP5_9SPHI|nr:hypothetical protein [Mucilaginibacter conchicola]RFZ94637.1 hypothetical protein D0C36_03590 [Mucilaginibacter conchicola]